MKKLLLIALIGAGLSVCSCGSSDNTKTTVKQELGSNDEQGGGFAYDPNKTKSIELKAIRRDSLVDEYLHHSKALTTLNKNGNEEILRYLILDAGHLKKLIDTIGGTEIMLAFAIRPQDADEPDTNQHFTVIFGAVRDSLLITEYNKNTALFEYCKPCPPECGAKNYDSLKTVR